MSEQHPPKPQHNSASAGVPAGGSQALSAEEKRALLAKLLQKKQKRSLFPLSAAQRRLWTIWQYDPRTPAYNVPLGLRYKNSLDAQVLERCFQEIIRRHETLRTTFPVVDGQPMQEVAPMLAFTLPVVDLRSLPEAEREAALLRYAEDEVRRPFDLEHGPLFRFSLVMIHEDDVALLMYMHHIVSDGWSLNVLRYELETLYAAFSAGQPSPLPELPIQYADYAAWQQKQLSGERLEALQAYWKEQLRDAPHLLDLHTDRSWPSARTYQGAGYHFRISAAATEGLRALSRRYNTTLFAILMAAYHVLLYRYTGQSDILVGTALTNRNRKEIEGLIGFFVNLLVIRAHMGDRSSGSLRFSDLLSQVRQAVLDAHVNEMPFEQILDLLGVERTPAHTPLFQASFTLLEPILEDEDVNDSLVPVDTASASFEILLHLTDQKHALAGYFQYSTDLFDEPTIARMADHYVTLLESIVADPEQDIATINIIPAGERQALAEWNRTSTDYPANTTIHALFEAQAVLTPDAMAVTGGGITWTYRELNQQADRVSALLRRLGVKPGDTVAVCMERSPEMIAGILGILKTGSAFVPLDSAFPTERLAIMLADTRAMVLLTHSSLVDHLPVFSGKMVCMDGGWAAEFEAGDAVAPAYRPSADDLAYVMFTSGSTGQPKGICIPHRAVIRLVRNTNYVSLGPDDRVVHGSNVSFDASTFEIWGALLNGGCLLCVSKDLLLSPHALAAFLKEQRATTILLTTALFNELVKTIPSIFGTMKYVLFGGEAVTPRLVRDVLMHGAPQNLLHVYGPTENTTFSSTYLVEAVAEDVQTVPIGAPLANDQCYVLDERLQPVPLGVPGELYVGGDGLAWGYLNKPEQTAEKFIPNPYTGKSGSRLYATGDIVRVVPENGKSGKLVIEFIGRRDHQVKIHGFRIELGEIEMVLGRHPAVRSVFVVVREDQPGEKLLVAYVIANPGQEPTADDLRAHCKQRLPVYMVPVAFVFMEQLPLSPTGKVDRKRLPAPQREPVRSDNFSAPATELEAQLAQIWSEVLGLERVGVDDNFFILGGDSILGIQIVSRVNEAGWSINSRHLFLHQTVRELAAAIASEGAGQAAEADTDSTGLLPLLPIQRWFFEQELTAPQHFNQAVALDVPRPLDTRLLQQALQALLDQHDALRMRFQNVHGDWQAACLPPGQPLAWSEVDASGLDDAGQQQAFEAAAVWVNAGLDLTEGPLLRAAYLHFSPRRPDCLLIAIHHLVVDGVSWRILLEDLHAFYAQLAQAGQVQRPRKTTSIRQWAERLEGYAHSEALRRELAFWQEQPPARAASDDCPRVFYGDAQTITLSLSEAETNELLRLPQVGSAQVTEVLLAALALAFSRQMGERELLIDLESHGREPLFDDIDLSRTVGWFTAIYPLRIAAAEDGERTLAQIKEQLNCLPNHGIGYGVLRYLHSDASNRARLGSQPPARISFNYLGRVDQGTSDDALFRFSARLPNPMIAPVNRRAHLFDINSQISGGCLQITWIFNPATPYGCEEVQSLAEAYLAVLRTLIAGTGCGEKQASAQAIDPKPAFMARLGAKKLGKLSQILEQLDEQDDEA